MEREIFRTEDEPLIEEEPGFEVGRIWKILAGIGAFLPIGAYILILPFILNLTSRENDIALHLDWILEGNIPFWFPLVIFGGIIWVVAVYGTMGGFIFHAIKNPRFSTEQKVLWCLGVFLGNMIVYPMYWYHHILHGSKRMGLPPNKKEQNFVGLLSFLPLILVVAIFLYMVVYAIISRGTDPSQIITMTWALLYVFTFFPTWIYMMIHIFKNPLTDGSKKALWFVLIFLFAWITMPIYWAKQIRYRS